MRTVQKGFTLTELMIVVVVLSILTLIAYPSYKTYTRRVRLTEVRTTLLHNAQTMERFYRQKGTFENYDQTKLEQNTYFDITLSKVSSDQTPIQPTTGRPASLRSTTAVPLPLPVQTNPAPASTDPPPKPETRKNAVRTLFQTAFLRVCPIRFFKLETCRPRIRQPPRYRISPVVII